MRERVALENELRLLLGGRAVREREFDDHPLISGIGRSKIPEKVRELLEGSTAFQALLDVIGKHYVNSMDVQDSDVDATGKVTAEKSPHKGKRLISGEMN